MRTFLRAILIFLLILIGCSSPEEPKVFVFEPVDGISFKFEILKMLDPSYSKDDRENRYEGVNYRLTLTNNTEREIYFNPGNVRVRINGVASEYTRPQGLGSGEWTTKPYPTGSTVFNSISMFPEKLVGVKIEDIRTFSLESTGLEGPP